MGHFESKCRAPKSNQKHKPVPEGRSVRFTNHQHEDNDDGPQTAVRSKTIAMARSGYDNSGLTPNTYQLPTTGLYKSEETLKEEEYIDKQPQGKRHFITRPPKPDLESTWKGVTSNITDDCIAVRQAYGTKTVWEPVPKPNRNDNKRPDNSITRTIAIVRRGDSIPDRQPRPVTPPPTNRERRATMSEEHQEKDDLRRRFYTRDEGTPWVHPGREVRLARKLGLPVADQDIIAPVEEYPETEDEQDSGPSNEGHWIHDSLGNRMWTKPMEMYNDLANERQEPTEDKPVYIRAYDMQLGRNPHHMIPKEREDDNPRMAVTYPNHKEISWASCVIHTYQIHKKDKIYQNCYPVRTNNTPI
ncbi:gag polyprotein [Ilyonectria robusta]